MRQAAKNLKIQLSRFESLEKLSRVGLDIDVATQATLQEGSILRALLRQKRFSPRSIAQQVLTLTAVSEHWLSDLKPWQAVLAVEALVELRPPASFQKSSARWIVAKCHPPIGNRQSRS